MIPKEYLEILKIIFDKAKNINQALTGSLSKLLLGMDLKPNDVDIITDNLDFLKKSSQNL